MRFGSPVYTCVKEAANNLYALEQATAISTASRCIDHGSPKKCTLRNRDRRKAVSESPSRSSFSKPLRCQSALVFANSEQAEMVDSCTSWPTTNAGLESATKMPWQGPPGISVSAPCGLDTTTQSFHGSRPWKTCSAWPSLESTSKTSIEAHGDSHSSEPGAMICRTHLGQTAIRSIWTMKALPTIRTAYKANLAGIVLQIV